MSTSTAIGRAGLALALMAVSACGGASNAEKMPVMTGGGGAAAGSSGGGTSGGGTGGGTGGSGGVASGTGGAGGTCAAPTSLTLAVHVIMNATWPATTATNGGSGPIHLWNLSVLGVSGMVLDGPTVSCGTALPAFALNAIGSAVAGGSQVQVQIPDAVWDAPSIPKFHSHGMVSGFAAGSTINIDPTVALVGLTLADPMAAWPMSYTGITTADSDGDGKPGITAMPRSGNGFVLPPTSLGLGGSAPAADMIDLASRTIVSLSGSISSCSDFGGSASVTAFDSHVVGCHVRGGTDCTASQTDFVDQSRTSYMITSATFTAKRLADGATCADARAALPM